MDQIESCEAVKSPNFVTTNGYLLFEDKLGSTAAIPMDFDRAKAMAKAWEEHEVSAP